MRVMHVLHHAPALAHSQHTAHVVCMALTFLLVSVPQNNNICALHMLADSYTTQGLAYGGPVVAVWGWVVVSFFSLIVAACMAELLSAFPTSGAVRCWQYNKGL